MKVYNNISLNLLQSSLFQIQYSATSVNFIEIFFTLANVGLHYRTATIIRSDIIITAVKFTKPRYIIERNRKLRNMDK